ncbi:MAG: Mth938-like domain-containing protein [Alphaproteobacteria bacterium]|nr:Mth938-like domain-containing protein [Alphaproteobacteria bacterium]MCB9974564.1 Mth938-like domain-containing protein [Rhodospirillales bacterium]
MDVTPLVQKGQQIIQGYAGGIFKVSGLSYQGSIIIRPIKTCIWELKAHASETLTDKDFSVFEGMCGEIDILIIGTGARHIFIPPLALNALKLLKINTETMDTAAACRTYNVLMAEGRRVAAALMPVTDT